MEQLQQNSEIITPAANTIRLTARTDTGMVRESNEDNYIVCPDLQKGEWFLSNEEIVNGAAGSLLVVADGMGGLNAGEVASAIAVDSIKRFFTNTNPAAIHSIKDIQGLLEQSILFAHESIVTHSKFHPESKGMGTTLVLAYIRDGILHTAWAGDSRCYILRNNKTVTQATKDHSYVQTLVDAGQITPEQAFYHPEGNIIIQSLGDTGKKAPKPECNSYLLEKGDRILLCSDGLNGMLMDDVIARLLMEEKEITECGVRLINEAKDAGGHDNITVVLCDIIGEPICQLADQSGLKQLALQPEFKPDINPPNYSQTQKVGAVESELKTGKTEKKINKAGVLFISFIVLTLLCIAFYLFGGWAIINKRDNDFISDDDSITLKKKGSFTEGDPSNNQVIPSKKILDTLANSNYGGENSKSINGNTNDVDNKNKGNKNGIESDTIKKGIEKKITEIIEYSEIKDSTEKDNN